MSTSAICRSLQLDALDARTALAYCCSCDTVYVDNVTRNDGQSCDRYYDTHLADVAYLMNPCPRCRSRHDRLKCAAIWLAPGAQMDYSSPFCMAWPLEIGWICWACETPNTVWQHQSVAANDVCQKCGYMFSMGGCEVWKAWTCMEWMIAAVTHRDVERKPIWGMWNADISFEKPSNGKEQCVVA